MSVPISVGIQSPPLVTTIGTDNLVVKQSENATVLQSSFSFPLLDRPAPKPNPKFSIIIIITANGRCMNQLLNRMSYNKMGEGDRTIICVTQGPEIVSFEERLTLITFLSFFSFFLSTLMVTCHMQQ